MRFIVSPAKKMNAVDDAFAWRDLPRFLERTDLLVQAMRGLNYAEAQALWCCSDALTSLNYDRFQAMDVRSGSLTPAILAYEGIQYQHMAPGVMDASQLDYLQEHLRILSGFYGVLRPLDGVVPYRLEMQAKLAVEDARDLYHFWGDRSYEALASECETIVNLASVEYAKAVVPHALLAGKTVVTCLFGTLQNKRLVQRSTAAKAARGSMVRWCAEHEVQQVQDLRAFDVAGYRFNDALSTQESFVFVQEQN